MFYKVPKESETGTIIKTYFEEYSNQIAKYNELANKYAPEWDSIKTMGGRFGSTYYSGISFKKGVTPNKLWRYIQNKDKWVISTRTNEGKKINDEFEGVKVPNLKGIMDKIGMNESYEVKDGDWEYTPGIETFEDVYIIHIQDALIGVYSPNADMIEITGSELTTLKK